MNDARSRLRPANASSWEMGDSKNDRVPVGHEAVPRDRVTATTRRHCATGSLGGRRRFRVRAFVKALADSPWPSGRFSRSR